VTPLSDQALAHLRAIADRPDLTGTRYELIEPLGRGGMGAVYLVRDTALERPVALKVLSDPDPDPVAAARLVAEARIVARLEHPGIVPVHEVGTLADGRVFDSMKRVEGRRLDALARERPPLPERLRIFERICEPVAFAHAHGVIHRDLKPENVMVGAFGEVLVMDWGLALHTGAPGDHDGARDEGTGPPRPPGGLPAGGSEAPAHRGGVGTPGYMAPEQARGEPVDERADVYSLGGVLYFLLTGRGPEVQTQDPTLSRDTPGGAATTPVPPPRRIDPRIPRPLDSICLTAMALDPAARYRTVSELSADIARFLADGRVRAHRETPPERIGRFVHRYRAPIALVAAYLAMRVILLLVARS
jgi:serine/threonine protein kinase